MVISTSFVFSLFDAMHVTDCDLSGYLLRNSRDSSRIRSEVTAESLIAWTLLWSEDRLEMLSNQDIIWPPVSMDL